MTSFCTVIARNYLAHARVLARSIHDHNDRAGVYVLVIDDEGQTLGRGEPDFQVLRPTDIGLTAREFHDMASVYSVTELSTAVKPWLLRTLLNYTHGSVVYLDPDIEVFSSLDEVAALAEEHDIVLTPHTLEPVKRDGFWPDEGYILRAGVFNLGFIAVGQGSRDFLDWWGVRLRWDCLNDPDAGFFVDQKWVDLVPGYFRHFILRSPAYNVAYWNADQRPLVRAAAGYEVAGEPLRFFHFSGFVPESPDQLCKYVDSPRRRLSDPAGGGSTLPRPRVRLDEHRVIAQLCRRYANRLMALGYLQVADVRYGLQSSSGGIPMDVVIRRLLRSALLQADSTGTTRPPDPFDAGEHESFVDWLSENVNPARPYTTRYLEALYEMRVDLQGAFPDLSGARGKALANWGKAQSSIPSVLVEGLPTVEEIIAGASSLPLREGVNVVGYVWAESGVGESARLLIETLKSAGVPYAVVGFRRTENRQNAVFTDKALGPPVFDVNIVCVNADELPNFVADGGSLLLNNRYTIGLWAWEVEDFPRRFRRSAEFVDEVWVYSAHAEMAVSKAISKPVLVFQLPIVAADGPPMSRRDLGVPDGFLFLFSFDFYSVFERKNPLAAVRAFAQAFKPGEGACLVIKSVNGDVMPHQLVKLSAEAALHPDVHVMDGYLDGPSQKALMAACDAYVSFHRAEGYGLTMAEAMALGKPVIATGYSGNLEFMNNDNSYLVPHRRVPIPIGCDPYPPGSFWAEPDIAEASKLMRAVFDNPAVAAEKGKRAAEDIRELHGPESRDKFVKEQVARGRVRLGSRDRRKSG